MLQSVVNLEPEILLRLQGFGIVLVLLWILERLLPARVSDYSKRALVNATLQLINLGLILLVPITLIAAALFALFNQFGVFNLIQLGLWTKIVACWLILDLLMYALHRAYHGIGLLWRFHKVHHSDQALDLTTTFRTHPVETLITLLVRAGAIVLLGMPLLGVIIYEIVVCAMALFIHANMRLNRSLDNLLRWILVTPSLHRIHHGADPEEYGSNFGLVISVWDRVFGTLRLEHVTADSTQIGLPESDRDSGVLALLKQPFGSTVKS